MAMRTLIGPWGKFMPIHCSHSKTPSEPSTTWSGRPISIQTHDVRLIRFHHFEKELQRTSTDGNSVGVGSQRAH